MMLQAPLDLLDAAERIVREKGLDALTMDSLAAAAQVSRATVYRQVGNREALLRQLTERGLVIGERVRLRERVLAAAAQLFPRLGLEATTVEAIAEAAGVGSASVYRHFGDKKGLILAFLAAQAPRKAGWALARKPSGDLAADLSQLALAALQHLKDSGPLIRLALLEHARGGELISKLSRSPDRTVHALESLLRHYAARGELRVAEPRTLARMFLGILFSLGLMGPMWGMSGDCDPVRDAQRAVALFLRGAAARKTVRKPSARRKS